MADRKTITAEYVRTLLDYRPETGEFFWRVDRAGSAKAGDRAGSLSKHHNRWVIKINSVGCKASRLAWLYMTGAWPPEEIDHKNRDPADDRWNNLRPATHQQNCRNRGNRSDKIHSKLKGVYRITRSLRWASCIFIDGRLRHLGSFDTEEEAYAAYLTVSKEYFGEFAWSE